MGACLSHGLEDKTLLQQAELISQSHKIFDTPMRYEDTYQLFPNFKNIEKMNHLEDKQFNLLKVYLTGPLNEFVHENENWKTKQSDFNHPNLLMVHMFTSETITSLLLPITKITLIFDYPLLTLQNHPKFTESRPLSENEVWDILDGSVAALSYLQGQKLHLGTLGMNEILQVATPFGRVVYKLIDGFFKPQSLTSFQRIMENADNMDELKELRKSEILSPIQIDAIRARNKFPVQNKYKSDVFVLGLITMFCLDLQPTWKMYNWDKWLVHEDKIKDRLNNLRASRYMKQLLSNMIEVKEDQRMDFIQLDIFLTSLFEKMQKKRLLEEYTESKFLYSPSGSSEVTPIEGEKFGKSYHQATTEGYHSRDPSDHQMEKYPFPNAGMSQTQKSRYQSSYVGRINYPIGLYYEGQLLNDLREGTGVLFDKDGQKMLEGNWHHDMPNGDAIIYNPDGQSQPSGTPEDLSRKDWIRYEGVCKQGHRHGLGNLFFQGGDRFTGEFVNDTANGQGMYVSKNGQLIKGEWKNNRMQND